MSFRPGMVVELHGLKAIELNGSRGLCLEYVDSSQRYKVKLVNNNKNTTRSKSRPTSKSTDTTNDIVGVKRENLRLADEVVEKIQSSPWGASNHCQIFADGLFNSLARPTMQDLFRVKELAGEGETLNLSKVTLKPHCLCQVNAVAACHSFCAEFIECRDGTVYARILQAFRNHFTGREWLEKVKWMDWATANVFFDRLALLKKKIDTFVKEDLVENVVVPQGQSKKEFTEWYANDILEKIVQYGHGPFKISVNPHNYDVEAVKKYGQETGGIAMTHKKYNVKSDATSEFALVYRVEPWADILRLCESLFGAAQRDFSLSAMRTQGPMSWIWQRAIGRDTYER